jgi:hypothetical protein
MRLAAVSSVRWLPLRAALLVWVAWTGLALVFTLYVMLPSPAAGDPGEWARATAWQVVNWWSWAVTTPLVVAIARRALHRRPWYSLLIVHLAASVLVSGFCTALQGAGRWLAFSGVRVRYDITGASSVAMADAWSFNVVVYAMVVGVFYVLRSARLEGQLARSRLDALSARLRPHFLFNTLNAISTLVVEDPKAANQMIGRLSELLRQAFDRGDETEVTLEEELRLLEHYIAIQELRFGERLRVSLQVEPGVKRGRVPALLLQPLVENAVSHGLGGRGGAESVAVLIKAGRLGNRLRLAVQDQGPGFSTRAEREDGVGLASTRARLLARYGTTQSLELANVPGGGALVTIEIPFTADAGPDC